MRRIIVDVNPKDFEDWLNYILQVNKFDIYTNSDVIFDIINKYHYQLYTPETRERLKNDLLNHKNVKTIKSIRQEKILQLNDISNGYKR